MWIKIRANHFLTAPVRRLPCALRAKSCRRGRASDTRRPYLSSENIHLRFSSLNGSKGSAVLVRVNHSEFMEGNGMVQPTHDISEPARQRKANTGKRSFNYRVFSAYSLCSITLHRANVLGRPRTSPGAVRVPGTVLLLRCCLTVAGVAV